MIVQSSLKLHFCVQVCKFKGWFQIWRRRRLGQGGKSWDSWLLDTTLKIKLVISFVFRSSLRIEMHQLHQLHDQLIFIKISSDKESEDSFIKENQNFRRRQNLSMGNNPNSIKFIKLRSRKRNFFLLWFHLLSPGNPRFSTHTPWHLAAIVREFS